MEINRLFCGDATKEMQYMPDGCVDLVIADTPYNFGKDYGNNHDLRDHLEYVTFTRDWLKQAI